MYSIYELKIYAAPFGIYPNVQGSWMSAPPGGICFATLSISMKYSIATFLLFTFLNRCVYSGMSGIVICFLRA